MKHKSLDVCSATKLVKVNRCLITIWSQPMMKFGRCDSCDKNFKNTDDASYSHVLRAYENSQICLFQEWVNWCLGYRSWECDFGGSWMENPGIHLYCVHEKISWDKTKNVKIFISINRAKLSKHMHFDLSFPIKLKNQPKNLIIRPRNLDIQHGCFEGWAHCTTLSTTNMVLHYP